MTTEDKQLKHFVTYCSVCGKPMPIFRETKPGDDEVFTHNKCKSQTTEDKAREYAKTGCSLYMDSSDEQDIYTEDIIMAYQNGHNSRDTEVAELKTEIKELEAEKKKIQEWVSVSHELPPHETKVLMKDFEGNIGIGIVCIGGFGDSLWAFQGDGSHHKHYRNNYQNEHNKKEDAITHWRKI